MSEYNKIETSAEVWAVIRAKHHKDLKVFESFSDPDGSFMGSDTCQMFTSYGFEGADYSFMQALTEWEKNPEKEYIRDNERTKYWLCVPIEGDEE